MNLRKLFGVALLISLVVAVYFAASFALNAVTGFAPQEFNKLTMIDSSGNTVDSEIKLINPDIIEVTPKESSVQKIVFYGTETDKKVNVGLDDVPREKTETRFTKTYAIDPTRFKFDNATVTVVAVADELWKCKEWNFSEQKCYGTWNKLMNIVPGEEYNFILTPEDPGYSEQPGNEGKDTYINSASATKNYGATTTIDLTATDTKRGLIEFNLSNISQTATITNATLTLYLTSKGIGASVPITIQRINNSWTEGTGDDQVTNNGASWNSRNGSVNWNTAGGDMGTIIWANTTVSTQDLFYNWNITTLVQNWVNGSYPNYGIILRIESGNGLWKFASSDNINETIRPQINITYTDAAVNDTNAPIVSLISPANNYTETNTQNVVFTYNVSDESNITECTLHIINYNDYSSYYPNTTEITLNTNQTITGHFNYNGNYRWKIVCIDATENVGSSIERNITASIAGIEDAEIEAAITYYLHNESDAQYSTYKQTKNVSTDLKSISSEAASLANGNVVCWNAKWIAPNWTITKYLNGTWTFNIYTNSTATSGTYYLIAKILKVNSTGEFNPINTSWAAFTCATGAATAKTWSYNVSNLSLNPGERFGIQICANRTTGSSRTVYMFWENTTSSSIIIQAADAPSTALATTLVSPANASTSSYNNDMDFVCNAVGINLTNITFYWNYSGTWQASSTVNITGTSNSTTFSQTNLNNGTIRWNCLACDNSSNCTFAPSNRTVTVNYSQPNGIQFGDNSSINSDGSFNTLNFSFDVNNYKNRILIVTTNGEVSSEVSNNSCIATNVTYNGIPLTNIASRGYFSVGGGGATTCTGLWYLLNPPVGTAIVNITYNSTSVFTETDAAAMTIYNTAQQPPENFTTKGISVSTPNQILTNITTLTDNAWLVDSVASGQLASFSVNTSGQVLRANVGDNTAQMGTSTKPTTTHGIYTIGWTQTGTGNRLAQVVAAFAAWYNDTTPPSTVTNLANKSAGTTWIYWNWTNPTTFDFNKSLLYLNGINVANTSNNYYNATGLYSGVNYTLVINTIDNIGNINDTIVSSTARTISIPVTVINESSSNSTGTTLNTTLILIADNGTTVYNNTNLTHTSITIQSGLYTVIVNPINYSIAQVVINQAYIGANTSKIVDFDSFSMVNKSRAFAVNPYVNFTSADITLIAAGTDLYKCINWNFTSENCTDNNWVKILDVVPGNSYTFTINAVDPGFYEINLTKYYFHNESDSQYSTYQQLKNVSTELNRIQSVGLATNPTGVRCWDNKWITSNFTTLVAINGTWNFTVYFNRTTGLAPVAYLFGRIFKINNSGTEIEIANSTNSADIGGATAVTAFNWGYNLIATNISKGERVGVQICMNVTTTRTRTGYIHWENTTMSNVIIPIASYDDISPTINFTTPTETSGSFANRRYVLINVTANDSLSGLKNITIYLFNSSKNLINSTNSTVPPLFKNFSVSADGIYYFNATAWDNATNYNSTETRNITIDTIAPIISITYPVNANYSTNISALNYTISGAQSCWYSLNGGTNTTVTCGNNLTSLTSLEGNNTWRVYANDSAGNLNQSSVTFFKDTVSPLIDYSANTLANNSYSTNSNIYINTTWTELNFKNITFRTSIPDNYVSTTSITSHNHMILSSPPDGIYTYNVTICDIANNCNMTATRTIIIDTIAPTFSNLNVNPLNATAYSSGQTYQFNSTWAEINKIGMVYITFNNQNYSATNISSVYSFSISNLAVGTYNYTWYANDSLNNQNNTGTLYYTITPVSSQVNLTLNGSKNNITITQGSSINLNCSLITPTSGILQLYNNGNLINSGNSPIGNLTTFNSVGLYNITCIYPATQNYSQSYQTYYVNVTGIIDNFPTWNTNQTSIPLTYSTTLSLFNITWQDDKNVSAVLFESNFSGSATNYTMNRISGTTTNGVYNFSAILPAGTFYWKSSANDTINQRNTSSTWQFTIAQATPTLTINNQTSLNLTYPTQTNFNCTSNTAEITPLLFRNNANVSNPDVQTFGVGSYNYSCNNTATQNYSIGNAAGKSLTIGQNNTITCSLSFNPAPPSPITPGTDLNVSCSCTNPEANATLYRNGLNVTNENNLLIKLAANTYNYTCNVSSQNYTSKENSSNITVIPIVTTTTVSVNPLSPINYGIASNFSCSVSIPGLTANLTINGTNKDGEKGLNVTRATGNYTVNCSFSENQNYTSSSNQTNYVINKANSTLSLASSAGWNINQSASTTFTCTVNNAESELKLFENNVLLNSSLTNSVLFAKIYSVGGNYSINCNNSDSQNYTASSNLTALYVNSPPIIDLISPENNTHIIDNQTTTFNFTATDDINTTFSCSIYLDNSLNQTNSTTQNGTVTYFTINGISYATHTWFVNCSGGILNSISETRTFSVVDTAPVLSGVIPSAGSQYNQTNVIPLQIEVNKNSTVTANISWDSTSQIVNLIYNGTNWKYNGTFTNTLYPGTYTVNITATSVFGSINSTLTNFTINDITVPFVSQVQPSGQTYKGNTIINISANVSDYFYANLAYVQADVSWDSTSQIVNLSYNSATELFNGTFSNTTANDTYTITIIAADNAENMNDTVTGTFNIDAITPSFNSVSPSAGSQYNQSQTITLNINASENSTVTTNISWDSTSQIVNLIYGDSPWFYNSTFGNTLYPGTYNVNMTATDNVGNTNSTMTNFVVNDVHAPLINLTLECRGYIILEFNQSCTVIIAADVTDPYYNSLDKVWANISWDSTSQIKNMTYNSTTGRFEASFYNGLIGTYNVTVYANDTFSNTNNSQTSYYLNDSTPPLIINVNSTKINNTAAIITWNTDEDSDGEVDYGTTIALGNIEGDATLTTSHSILLNNLTYGQIYYYKVLDCDINDNCRISGIYNFTIIDTIPPQIIDYFIGSYAPVINESVFINATATDDLAVDRIFANVTLPDGNTTTINIPGYFNVTQIGQHNVTIWANDTFGNPSTITTDYFISGQNTSVQFNVVDNTLNGITSNLTIYLAGTDKVVHEHDFIGSQLENHASTLYDLLFKTYSDSAMIKLLRVNISVDSNSTLGVDKTTTISGYLVTYGINNSYISAQNATLTLSYNGTGYGNEDALSVEKCSSWEFTTRTCNVNWIAIPANQNKTTHAFTFNVTSFSAFSIKEALATPEPARRRGGSGGVYETCNESWQCNGWSSCDNGITRRTCFDLNSCGTEKGKPEEIGSCVAVYERCFDNIQNQDESDVDCGGGICSPCETGYKCTDNRDCQSGYCYSRTCNLKEVDTPATQKELPAPPIFSWMNYVMVYALLVIFLVYLIYKISPIVVGYAKRVPEEEERVAEINMLSRGRPLIEIKTAARKNIIQPVDNVLGFGPRKIGELFGFGKKLFRKTERRAGEYIMEAEGEIKKDITKPVIKFGKALKETEEGIKKDIMKPIKIIKHIPQQIEEAEERELETIKKEIEKLKGGVKKSVGAKERWVARMEKKAVEELRKDIVQPVRKGIREIKEMPEKINMELNEEIKEVIKIEKEAEKNIKENIFQRVKNALKIIPRKTENISLNAKEEIIKIEKEAEKNIGIMKWKVQEDIKKAGKEVKKAVELFKEKPQKAEMLSLEEIAKIESSKLKAVRKMPEQMLEKFDDLEVPRPSIVEDEKEVEKILKIREKKPMGEIIRDVNPVEKQKQIKNEMLNDLKDVFG